MIIDYTSALKTTESASKGKIKNLTSEDREKLKKAAFDFQALLINQMLQSMRETQFQDEDETGFGYGEDTMNGLFDMQLSFSLSKSSRFGLAEMIYEKLTGEKLIDAVSTDNSKKAATILPEVNILQKKKNSNNSTGSETKEVSENIIKTNKYNASKYSTNIFDAINKYDEIIESSAESQNVDPALIKAIIAAESNGNPNAVSKAKAKGLMQLIDSTAKSVGVKNVFNPSDNIVGGTKYFSALLERYDGNVKYALAAYNAGPGAVDKYNGIPPYKETQNYVNKVLNYYSAMKAKQQEIASNE